VAGDIDPEDAAAATTACASSKTRYQRYSCVHGFGHAFMRVYGDQLEPGLDLCRALGPDAAPDCAQGAFHDYWFAAKGADDASLPEEAVRDPRALCGSQPEVFVRPCWYRALLENRPEGFQAETAEDLEVLCEGLEGVQREACMTAMSVIGPPDPREQLRLCADLADETDAASCARGTKVQNLIDSPTATYVRVIRGCRRLPGTASTACFRWLGKTLSVLTDGRFAREGCPQVSPASARRACEAGAATMDEPLVTFS